MNRYVADFETITYECMKENNLNKTYVWAAACVAVDTKKVCHLGNSIEGFMEYVLGLKQSSEIYFHNLKFDGAFILNYLYEKHEELGFKIDVKDEKNPNTIHMVISEACEVYQIRICKLVGKRKVFIYFRDSAKKIPLSVADIAKSFKLEQMKGSIDYHQYRSQNHELTEEEKQYILNDCFIVADALKEKFDMKLDKMTLGADALSFYKKTVTRSQFENMFPVLSVEMDDYIREAFKGGFVYLKKGYENQVVNNVSSYDANSMYPSIMKNEFLPYGWPVYGEGQFFFDDVYKLAIMRIKICFTVKPDHIPCVQIRDQIELFEPNEYLEDSQGIIEMTVTNIDLALISQQYDIHYLEYIDHFKFKAQPGMFNKYIKHWETIKTNPESTAGQVKIAKLMLNNLFGKFSTKPRKSNMLLLPDNKKQGALSFVNNRQTIGAPVYTALSTFVTAYARFNTVKAAQANYDRFIYSDTDSIKLEGFEAPKGLRIHQSNFGAWKCEGQFDQVKFIKAKTYAEFKDGQLNIKCAGMPDSVRSQITSLDDFSIGTTFKITRLSQVVGGSVITQRDFTL